MAGEISREEIEKRIKALSKKLTQIEFLKEKSPDQLDADAREKMASEPSLQKELAALEVQKAGGPAPAPAPVAIAPAPVAAAPAPAPAPVAAEEDGLLSEEEKEKRIKAIKKKLAQIDKLKEKDSSSLDVDAKAKLASEAELQEDLASLEGRAEGRPKVVTSKKPPAPAAAKEAKASKDPHAAERAKALESPSADLGLLLDDETEKRFKALQKKLRDIGKLHERDVLDKLQTEKLLVEPDLIKEIQEIQAKADAKLQSRREMAAAKAATKPPAKAGYPSGAAAEPQAAPRRKPAPAWECPSCDASGGVVDLQDGDGLHCPKCGYDNLKHSMPEKEEEEEEDDDATAAAPVKTFESKDLKTKRQNAQPAGKKKDEEVTVGPASAKWPEVKEVLESGDCGVDKSRQKKAIAVNRPKLEAPYDVFDTTLLKCSFLTRVELKLPVGVLAHENFMVFFPGPLSDSLLELILKENKLPAVPPGLHQLSRIRSIDLSHNLIEVLPDEETWKSIAGSLEMLDLSFNKLSSVASLAPLAKLSQLKLDANQLTSLAGVSWKELKQLSSMSAVGNQIEELSDDIGAHAVSLEHLELSENKIKVLPSNLSELKKLKLVGVGGNPIKDQKAVKAAEKGAKDLKTYLAKLLGGKK
ncbi:unnamed protein product [Polarella glacialis]|uniref:Uncharacterized protein n=1 Tax=Polarella glacialis TaxID=89957 RepID=A0A813E5K7_POLGL|nr:unnamed protein product [Polarella glacialis]CAE8628640.1 unnamed protein product [Polarella glacialis]